MSLWSYCCLCADMADFASRDNNTCNFFPFSSLYFSITQTIVDITISIYAQKSTATDRYWWSFGPAKFESTTARFDAETRWAVSSSISALSWQIIYQNVDDYIVYHLVNRDVDTMTESYQNTVQNSGVLARRLVSWFEVGGVWRTVFLAGERAGTFPRGGIFALEASKSSGIFREIFHFVRHCSTSQNYKINCSFGRLREFYVWNW
jgi:hypothetical protein